MPREYSRKSKDFPLDWMTGQATEHEKVAQTVLKMDSIPGWDGLLLFKSFFVCVYTLLF